MLRKFLKNSCWCSHWDMSITCSNLEILDMSWGVLKSNFKNFFSQLEKSWRTTFCDWSKIFFKTDLWISKFLKDSWWNPHQDMSRICSLLGHVQNILKMEFEILDSVILKNPEEKLLSLLKDFLQDSTFAEMISQRNFLMLMSGHVLQRLSTRTCPEKLRIGIWVFALACLKKLNS